MTEINKYYQNDEHEHVIMTEIKEINLNSKSKYKQFYSDHLLVQLFC